MTQSMCAIFHPSCAIYNNNLLLPVRRKRAGIASCFLTRAHSSIWSRWHPSANTSGIIRHCQLVGVTSYKGNPRESANCIPRRRVARSWSCLSRARESTSTTARDPLRKEPFMPHDGDKFRWSTRWRRPRSLSFSLLLSPWILIYDARWIASQARVQAYYSAWRLRVVCSRWKLSANSSRWTLLGDQRWWCESAANRSIDHGVDSRPTVLIVVLIIKLAPGGTGQLEESRLSGRLRSSTGPGEDPARWRCSSQQATG